MIEVYAVKLNFSTRLSPGIVDELMNQVDPSKESRLRRFVREEDRLRGLFADLLIRDLIMKKLMMNNEDIEFTTNEYGKPFLKTDSDFYFNISHSGNWVVCAIDCQHVGIDIEEIQPIDLDISKHYFSEDEHRDLMAKEDRLSYFFTLWSLKESYIKILGKGLSHPLNAFSIKFVDEKEIIIKENGFVQDQYRFAQYDIDKSYKMGLCAMHKSLPNHVDIRSMEDLIRVFIKHYDTRQYWNPLITSPKESTSPVNGPYGTGFQTYRDYFS